MDLATLAAVAVAGAAGAVLRHAANLLLKSAWPDLPLAIALVNVAGCVGFGVCWSLLQQRCSPLVATAVLAGFFGAFTTFSSFAFDCHELFAQGRLWLWAANVIGQNVLGLVGMAAGIAAGRAFGGV